MGEGNGGRRRDGRGFCKLGETEQLMGLWILLLLEAIAWPKLADLLQALVAR